ncbi:MAG: hypothetical protein KDA91_11390, partial [Planctomycetaceae bacterium]|nr:hypothetical protein [Planctomycetaceae bacterium]
MKSDVAEKHHRDAGSLTPPQPIVRTALPDFSVVTNKPVEAIAPDVCLVTMAHIMRWHATASE